MLTSLVPCITMNLSCLQYKELEWGDDLFSKTQMLKGILEGCVLKVVSDSPSYSLEIAKKLRELGFEEISEGTIYPLLLRLEKEGLFITEKVKTNLGPDRKYYRLSSKGMLELSNFVDGWRNFKKIIDSILESEVGEVE